MTHKTRSRVHAYDILYARLDVRGKKIIFEASRDSCPELSHNVQDFNESMLSKNITLDDFDRARIHWKRSGRTWPYFLNLMPDYQSSPFPYRWEVSTRSSIMPPDGSMAVRGRCDQIPLIPSSFKSRFHKATLRREMLMKLLLVEKEVRPNFSGIYREWFDKISNGDERWSFLEYLEGLELKDYWFGFHEWVLINDGDTERIRNMEDWSVWYSDFGTMSVHEQAGIIEYSDLADRALEPPDSFKRLISSEGLPRDLEISLIQASPRFRRNWPQTARCTAFSLHDSREALLKMKEWMETSSDTERLLLEDSGRSSLQEGLLAL